MFLAGVSVADDLVLELARTVDDPDLAERLERCYELGMRIAGLTVDERETVLLALDDPPRGLEQLRAVLLQERVARARGVGA